MSHFSVLVIGPDVEAQLQPYHEYECTDCNDQYVITENTMDEARLDYAACISYQARQPDYNPKALVPTFDTYAKFSYSEGRTIGINEQPDIADKHRFGWVRVNAAGKVIEITRRTNPNARWDWWVIGGRWANYIKIHKQVPALEWPADIPNYMKALSIVQPLATLSKTVTTDRVNSARLCDIDLAGIRTEAGVKAGEDWDRAAEIIKRSGIWTPRKLCKDMDEHWQQPGLRAFQKEFKQWHDCDRFLMSRDGYVELERARAFCTYAMLHNGVWMERGEMGWFGCSSNEMSEEDWILQFNQYLDTLPPDTLVTVVDCHI